MVTKDEEAYCPRCEQRKRAAKKEQKEKDAAIVANLEGLINEQAKEIKQLREEK